MNYYPQSMIQNLSQPSSIQCYYVNSQTDLDKVSPTVTTLVLGLNQLNNEIYLRQINNLGLVETIVYEKKKDQDILDRLERKLDDVQSKLNKQFIPDVNERNVEEPSVNAAVQPINNGTNS